MDELDNYARAAARLSDLPIEDAWWPGVVRHLGVLFDRAALVEAVPIGPGAGPGPPADGRGEP